MQDQGWPIVIGVSVVEFVVMDFVIFASALRTARHSTKIREDNRLIVIVILLWEIV